MPKFRAMVRVVDLEADDLATAQRQLDDKMRQAGFARWQVVSIQTQGRRRAQRPFSVPRIRSVRGDTASAGGLLLVIAVAWLVWFVWFLAE